ncbi:ferrochelatase [Segniliparus rugosus]|uniref:Coproporphyrin III ferrochelatase n=1 Tax=Segniliparus rugosus (strain ATCC BAA-974 / DSM 45345 / CCUG 50838 / CIP 108380 / JCM 13579 / CDC 945) TaxID=679197 RepID=E5XKJ7_SEGRC|nr:ferrochelatase [Segniliparus rugosus]EFV15109.1 ferrochelatase [Segniliparus rugosus ATCC BAA-974]
MTDAPPPDALLFLSFGGPEGPDEVMPFLRRVTEGRNVPDERLAEVAEHYYHFGGVSPINRLNREIIANVEQELAAEAWDLPVYFGNRNWHPFVEDTVARMARDGVRRALVFATSAWGGYSGDEQYREDIARARASVGGAAPLLEKLPQFWDHPLFVEAFADAVRAARRTLPDSARLVFTAHSVPLASGGRELYEQQVREAAALVARAVGERTHDVVWQSRSGPPSVPWLEPDVCDHIESLAAQGVCDIALCPIGFVSDHIEVVWDLDNEAKALAESLGVRLARAKTPGPDPRFAKMVVELARAAAG